MLMVLGLRPGWTKFDKQDINIGSTGCGEDES